MHQNQFDPYSNDNMYIDDNLCFCYMSNIDSPAIFNLSVESTGIALEAAARGASLYTADDGMLFISMSENTDKKADIQELYDIMEFYPGAQVIKHHRNEYDVHLFGFPLKPRLE